MSMQRMINRKERRKKRSLIKKLCMDGHEPIYHAGGGCPVCFREKVINWYLDTANQLAGVIEKFPNRVTRGAR